MKPAEGGEGEMLVTAAVLQVSAAGCRESTAALPAVLPHIGLPLVPNLAVTRQCFPALLSLEVTHCSDCTCD